MRSPERSPVRVNPVLLHPADRRLSLDGDWLFRLDPKDEGVSQKWFVKPRLFRDRINVPGCWQGQGLGHDGTDEIWDFRIKARTYRATYKGTGWYAKTFSVPGQWPGLRAPYQADSTERSRRYGGEVGTGRVWLNFGGVHPSADVWLNGKFLGSHSGPFVPFAYDVTDVVRRNAENFLAVRVHERDRWMGHAFNWQGNWSGLYRSVELTATGHQWIERCRILPDPEDSCLRMRVGLGASGSETPVILAVLVTSSDGKAIAGVSQEVWARTKGGSPRSKSAPPGIGPCQRFHLERGEVSFDIPVSSPKLWSPEEPNLYHVHVTLKAQPFDKLKAVSEVEPQEALDALSERVGFVKLSTRGKHFLINGQPYFMRGSGDFVVNPETGCPDTNRDRWRRKLKTLREYGYNYVRLQSYAAAPEYYDVADEVGLLVQSEMGMLGAWAGHAAGLPYGRPQPSPEFYPALKWHWDRTVLRDVNHPSANMYCMANELYKDTDYPEVARECYRDTKAIKPSALVIWSDGNRNPALPADFANAEASDDPKWNLPLIQHEYRWWTSYPDVRIKKKYTGAVRPCAIELAEAAAAGSGMSRLLPAMAANSQRLQYIEARGKMEACRRDHPTLAGISHFCAMDAGPAVEGIFDDFYGKKFADAALWRRTNGDTVLLMGRNFDDRVLASGDLFEAPLFVSDFSHPSFRRPVLEWQWTSGQQILAEGRMRFDHQPFRVCPAGRVTFSVLRVKKPLTTTLRATLREGGRNVVNEWAFWIFPSSPELPVGVGAYRMPDDTWLKDLPFLHTVTTSALGGPASGGGALVSGALRHGARGAHRPPRVLVSESLNEAVISYVRKGGRLLLAHSRNLPLRPFPPKLGLTVGRYFFTPPANYRPFESGNAGTIIADHPILGDFPHEGFADLQFYRMIAESPPLDLKPFAPARLQPVIRSLTTYFICHPVGYLIEFGVEKGGVIFCALDLSPKYPEARYLLSTILRYAAGKGRGTGGVGRGKHQRSLAPRPSPRVPRHSLPVDVLRKFSATKEA